VELHVVAENAFELGLAVVVGDVDLESGLGAVAALADGAPEGLGVVVGADVGFQVVGAGEGSLAVRAVEVLLA